MLYDAFSLNGSWEMGYLENEVSGTAEPSFSGCVIPEAVPGYWEDMVDAFANAPFCSRLKINPEYGIQRYPMSVGAPDMALPNITGTFLYRRSFLTEETEGAWELAFSGVQNRAAAWLNGTYLGSHEGYSTPFSLPIPKEALHQGENTLVIRDGRADIVAADCPDRLCVHQPSITRDGESIICLPHRITVTVEGGDAAAVDDVAGVPAAAEDAPE